MWSCRKMGVVRLGKSGRGRGVAVTMEGVLGGVMVMVSWQWCHGNGVMAMVSWQWCHGNGDDTGL